MLEATEKIHLNGKSLGKFGVSEGNAIDGLVFGKVQLLASFGGGDHMRYDRWDVGHYGWRVAGQG
jgi:hypothetical protein